MPGIAEELFVDSEKLPIRLNCSICLDIAEAAVITACDHVFCAQCIAELQAANGENCECPNCREPVLPIAPAMNARNFVSQQLVYCSDIESLRCGWQGKYSMWHTHKAKYCARASLEDKTAARNARVCELGQYNKQELCTMSVNRMKKILQEYLTLNLAKLSASEKEQHFNYKKFLEKTEYVDAILLFQSQYGLAAKYSEMNSTEVNMSSQTAENSEACQSNMPSAFCATATCGSVSSSPSFPTTYEGLKKLKIRQLSQYLRGNNIDPQSPQYSCIEKKDLIELVLKTQQRLRDILDGHCYDPNMERTNFSSPPLRPTFPAASEFKRQDEEELKLDDGGAAAMPSSRSNTAYQINAEQLRQSSANRINLNPDPSAARESTAYSHVYGQGDDQHTTYVNRDNLANYDAFNSGDGSGDQCMYSSSPYNNAHAHDYHSLHANQQRNHRYPDSYACAQSPPPQHQHHHHHHYHGHPASSSSSSTTTTTTTSTTSTTNTHSMPQMPQMPAMPNMNVSHIFNDAMHTINNAVNSATNVFQHAFHHHNSQ